MKVFCNTLQKLFPRSVVGTPDLPSEKRGKTTLLLGRSSSSGSEWGVEWCRTPVDGWSRDRPNE